MAPGCTARQRTAERLPFFQKARGQTFERWLFSTHDGSSIIRPGGSLNGTKTQYGFWVVFTTIFLDFIGFSVLIPVLPLYAVELGASAFEVGLILALYAASQLVFLPAWGRLSDHIGRRPVILVSLGGTVLSFLLLGAAHSLAMLYVARVLGGFFAASIGTAQAVVTDLTPPHERACGMGLIGAAFGLGFVLGNALGGELAAFHERIPFYTVAGLALANLGLAWWRLSETHTTQKSVSNGDASFAPWCRLPCDS